VAGGGDINGDGRNDILLSKPYSAPPMGSGQPGVVYALHGGATFADADPLSTLTAAQGVRMETSSTTDRMGSTLSNRGDLNGDGYDDIVTGALEGDTNGNVGPGRVYAVYGRASWGSATFNLSNLSQANGFEIQGGGTYWRLGTYGLDTSGDLNNDGYADILVGAAGAARAFIYYGGIAHSSPLNSASVNAAHGVALTGADYPGYAVSSGGDLNGDGIADAVISGWNTNNTAYILYGRTGNFTGPINLDTGLNGTTGFRVLESTAEQTAAVSIAGDINGDGYDDLLIGKYLADPGGRADAGRVYVLYGAASTPSTLTNADFDGTRGFVINGAVTGDRFGERLGGAGDLNGDGFADMALGASYADTDGLTNNGVVYAVYGQNFNSTVTGQLLGTSGDDVLNASGVGTTDKKLIGGLGNDTLIGDADTNVLYGGAGNDILSITDTTFRRIDGGSGIDTLQGLVGSAGTLDLSALNDESIRSIERIDMADGDNDTLRLGLRDVLHISETLAFADDATGFHLVIGGNAGDTVDFVEPVGAGGWVANGTKLFGGVSHNVYQYDDADTFARLLIHNQIAAIA
jgi:hypothetical protein